MAAFRWSINTKSTHETNTDSQRRTTYHKRGPPQEIPAVITARCRTLLQTESACPHLRSWNQLIAAGHVRERLCREHLDFMTQLKGVARNLNQLTRLAHAKGLTGIVSRHAAIVVEIESLLKNLRDDR